MKFRFALLSSLVSSTMLFAELPEKASRYHEALMSRPLNEQLFNRFYEAWLEEGKSSEMAEYLVTKAPSGWEGYVLLARYQMRVGKRQEAIQSLANAVKDAPNNADLRLMRAKLLIQELDFKSAAVDLEEVNKTAEGETRLEATRLLGMSLLRLDQVDKALALWSEELKKSDSGMEFVDAAASEGEYKKAAELCEKLVTITKVPYDKLRAQVKLGELQGLGGDTEKALQTLKSSLNATGNDSWLEREILRKADLILSRQGDTVAEVTFYEGLAESNPQRSQVRLAYAGILAENDRWDEAQGIFKELLQKNPADHGLRTDFIGLLISGEKFAEALSELDVLIDQIGAGEPLLLQRIDLLRSLQRQDEIKPVIAQIAQGSGQLETDRIKVAMLYIQNDFKKDGEEVLKQASAPPENFLAKESLANFYLTEQRKNEGVAILKEMAETGGIETLNRAAKRLSTVGESQLGYTLLVNRKAEFKTTPAYLTALCQLGLSSGNAEAVIPAALDLLHLSEKYIEVTAAVKTASRIITRAGKQKDFINTLKDKDSIQDRCLLAELYTQADDHQLAEQTLAPRVEQKEIIASYFWLDLLQRKRKLERATRLLEGLQDTEEGNKTLFLKKLSALQNQIGEFDKALATIERWKVVAPNDKQAWIQESQMLSSAGELEGAITTLRRAIARFDDHTDLQDKITQKYVEVGNYEEAMKILWDGFNSAPSVDDKINWSRKLISTSASIGQLYEVKSKFFSLRSQNTKAIAPVLALYQLADIEENKEEKLSYLKEALSLNPDNAHLLSIYASLSEENGNLKDAEVALLKATSISKKDGAEKKLLQFYLRTGNEEKALSTLNRIQKFSDARELEGVAINMINGGSSEIAERVLLQGMAAHPDDWRLTLLMGMIHEYQGRLREAAHAYAAVHTADNILEGDASSHKNQKPDVVSFNSFANAYNNFGRVYQELFSQISGRSRQTNILPSGLRDAALTGEAFLVRVHAKSTDLELRAQIQDYMDKEGVTHFQVKSDLVFQNMLKMDASYINLNNLDDSFKSTEFYAESRVLERDPEATREELVTFLTHFPDNERISGLAGAKLLSVAQSPADVALAEPAVISALARGGEENRGVFNSANKYIKEKVREGESAEIESLVEAMKGFYDNASEEFQGAFYALPFLVEVGDAERFIQSVNQFDTTRWKSYSKMVANFPYSSDLEDFQRWFYQERVTFNKIYDKESDGHEWRQAFLAKAADAIKDDYWKYVIYSVIGDEERAKVARAVAMQSPDKNFIITVTEVDASDAEGAFATATELIESAGDGVERAMAGQLLLSSALSLDKENAQKHQKIIQKELNRYSQSTKKYVRSNVSRIAAALNLQAPSFPQKNGGALARTSLVRSVSAEKRLTRYLNSGQKEKAASYLAEFTNAAILSNNIYYLEDLIRKADVGEDVTQEALDVLAAGAEQDILKAIPYYIACNYFNDEERAQGVFANLNDPRLSESFLTGYHALQRFSQDQGAEVKAIVALIKQSPDSVTHYTTPPVVCKYDGEAWIEWLNMVSQLLVELDDQGLISEGGGKVQIGAFSPVLSSLIESQSFHSIHYNTITQIRVNDKSESPKRDYGMKIADVIIDYPSTAEFGFSLLQFLQPDHVVEGRTLLQRFLLSGGLLAEQVDFSRNSYYGQFKNNVGSSVYELLFNGIAEGELDQALPENFRSALKTTQPESERLIAHIIQTAALPEEQLEEKISTLGQDFSLPESQEEIIVANAELLKPFNKEEMLEQLPRLQKTLQKLKEEGYFRSGTFDEYITVYKRAAKGLSYEEFAEMHLALAESLLGKKETWAELAENPTQVSTQAAMSYFNFEREISESRKVLPRLLKVNWQYDIPSNSNHAWQISSDLTHKVSHAESSQAIKAMEELGLLTSAADFFPLALKNANYSNPFSLTQRDYRTIFDSFHSNSNPKTLKVIKELKSRQQGRFGALFMAAMLSEYNSRAGALESVFSEFAKDLEKLPDWQLSAILQAASGYYKHHHNSNPKLAKLNSRLAEMERKRYEVFTEDLLTQLRAKNPLAHNNGQLYYLSQSVSEVVPALMVHSPQKAAEVHQAYVKVAADYVAKGGKISRYSSNSYQISYADEILMTSARKARESGRQSSQASLAFFRYLDAVLREEETRDHSSFSNEFLSECDYMMGYFLNGVDSENDEISKRSTPWLVIDKVAEKLSEEGEEAEALLSVALLNHFSENSTKWKVELDHDVIQKWSQKAEGSLIYQACLALAHYHAQIDDAEKRVDREFTVLKDYFTRLDGQAHIPSSLKASLIMRKSKRRGQSLLLHSGWHALTMQYLPEVYNGKRTARSAFTSGIVKSYSKIAEEKPEYGKQALALVTKGIAQPVTGEGADIPSSLIAELMELALSTQDHAAFSKILQASRGKLKGGLRHIEIILRNKDYKLLKTLLPAPNQKYSSSGVRALYDAELEASINGLRDEQISPLQLLRLEIALLSLNEERNPDQRATESKAQRAARLSEQLAAYATIDKKVLLDCVTTIGAASNGRVPTGIANVLVKDASLKSLYKESQNGANRQEGYEKLSLKIFLIGQDVRTGNVDGLAEFQKFLKENKDDYRLQQLFVNFCLNGLITTYDLIMAGNEEALTALLDFYKFAVLDFFTGRVYNSTAAESSFVTARLLADHLGKSGEVESWGRNLEGQHKKNFETYIKAHVQNVGIQYARLETSWITDDNKEKRIAFYTWLLQQPATLNDESKHGSLIATGAVSNVIVSPEELILIGENDKIPTLLRLNILKYKLRQAKADQRAAVHQEIITLAGEEFAGVSAASFVAVAGAHLKQKEFAKAEEVLNKIPSKDLPDNLKKRVQGMRKQIKKNKN